MRQAGGVVALTFAKYFVTIFFTGCEPPPALEKLVAILAISLLTAINCYSTKMSISTSDVLTAAKLLGLVVVILSAAGYLAEGN